MARQKADIPKELNTVNQAAKLWNLDPEEIKRARMQGADAFRNNRIQREPLVAWLKEHPPTEEDIESLDWKTRRLKGQAIKIELEVAKTKAELIERKTVEQTWGKYFGIVTEVIGRHVDRLVFNAIIKEIKSKLPTE